MFKHKTLFGKLFATYVTIAVIVIFLLALIMMQMLTLNSVERKKQELLSSISITNTYINQYLNMDITDRTLIERLNTKATERNSLILIVNEKGQIWFSVSDNEKFNEVQNALFAQMSKQFDTIKTGISVYSMLKAGETTSEPIMIVGSPIIVNGTVIGATFETAEVSDINKYFNEMCLKFIWAAGISFMVALMLIYITSRNIQKPINQISRGVMEFAKGNFKARIKTTDETEIGALVGTFNFLGEELEKYDYMRTSFVANVSHELRSPLTSIQGLVQGVLDGTVPEEDKKQYLEIVLAETKRMNVLIQDLLNLSKLESGQFPMNKTVFDINETALRVLFTFETKIDEKNLDVRVNMAEEKLYVNADPDRIIQVLTNLIANAVKFAEPNGILEISTMDSEGKAVVSIRDTGDVIGEEDMPYIFDRFFKVDKSHNRNEKGTGIGLSIVKNILDQHGQTITAESTKEKGTVFTFTLDKGVPKIADGK